MYCHLMLLASALCVLAQRHPQPINAPALHPQHGHKHVHPKKYHTSSSTLQPVTPPTIAPASTQESQPESSPSVAFVALLYQKHSPPEFIQVSKLSKNVRSTPDSEQVTRKDENVTREEEQDIKEIRNTGDKADIVPFLGDGGIAKLLAVGLLIGAGFV